MNNNLYHWHAEQQVRYEMQEIDRAVEQARLLREAGLAGPSWLARAMHAVKGLSNMLKARRKGLQQQRSIEPKVLPRKSPKSV